MITVSNLEAVVRRINTTAGTPQATYVKTKEKYSAQIGNYHISEAYGGYALHQIANAGGGVRDVFGGHMPKRELLGRMHAFLAGLESGSADAGQLNGG